MDRWKNKIAVVTGASSGICSAIVKDLAEHGLIAIGLARRVERVEALRDQLPEDKRNNLIPMKCDVSDVNSVNEIFDQIISRYGGVDVLINNAGCWKIDQLVTMDVAEVNQTLQTNVMGVVYCTQRAFMSMKDRKFNGHVIIINSIAGHSVPKSTGIPEFNIYCPSKYALTAATEIYRQEFRGLGTQIKITSISPGATDTEIIPDHMREYVGDCFLQPEDISSAVLFVISTPPHVQIHEMIIKPVGELY
ncbi:farnesol dehydrogenase-like [Haematobia irritans]|uniref:farnesol dehydrogenase-like n=1 Tax=Haematobia irritans TaxID=7368 RepID=UPI003F5099A7